MAKADSEKRIWMLQRMTESKMFEEKLAGLMMSGQIDTFYLAARGQEASSAALGAHFRKDDAIFTSYRGLTDQLCKGLQVEKIFAEIYGHVDGYCQGRGGPMHYMDWSVHTCASGVVGGGIPVAVGFGFAMKYKGSDSIAAANFGDGATDHGTFHEAMNFASLFSLPVVFLCQNNLYGEATPQAQHQLKVDIAERAAAYDMPGVTVDGNDSDECYAVFSEAVARARGGGGPTFVEAKTYRLMGHFIGDPMTYMPADEVEAARLADPVPAYRQRLIGEGVVSSDDVDAFEKAFAERLDKAVETAKGGSFPSLDTLTDYVYADNAYF